MNILPLLDKFTNNFNLLFNTNFSFYDLEEKIKSVGDNFTKTLYETFLTNLDLEFKYSNERKELYTVKDTVIRNLLTSIGYISFPQTIYKNKQTGKCFYFIRDIVLNIKPYQRMTDYAEFTITSYAMSENMAQAARHAIRDIEISRSCVSKKLKSLNGSIHEIINKSNNQPKTLYIEMDEIHANLQHGGNKICPCAIVHEGHKEEFVKRKKLKNVYNFASAKLPYRDLWNVIYDYVDKKYDIDNFDNIFVSGDGASGIKDYTDVFPNAIFVLDKFHYRKALNYIFKKEPTTTDIADSYLRNNNIKDFKTLVSLQLNQYPSQKDKMIEKQNYLIRNIEGIKNQNHPDYMCHCAMEGHVSNRYARYITSSPYGFSEDGLENKLKLLVLNANHHKLTFNEYLNLKYSNNQYDDINNKIKQITNIKVKINLLNDQYNELPNTISKLLDSNDNNFINNLLSINKAKLV